jgi:DNA repair exonuclease SbcCD ATPase subunit
VNIRNFMGIESADLSVNKPINIFVGENEAGKSSLRDAILWCLTGQARGLKTHQDQAALIQEGAKFAEVRIALGDGRAFIRRKTPKSPATETGFGVEPELPISPDILCDPYVFLLLPEQMRRQMFFALLPGLQPTAENIFGKLSQDKRFEPFNTADCRKIVEGLAQVAAKAGFLAAEKEAVTRRREAKRAKDTLGQVKDPNPEALVGDRKYNLVQVDTEDIERTLGEVQARRDELVKAKGQYEGDQAKARTTKDRLEKILSSVKGRLPAVPPEEGLVSSLEASLGEAHGRK